MHCYWINVASDTKRRAHMERQFERVKLDNTRIEASTPETFPPVTSSMYLPGSPHIKAVTCSHLNAIRAGYASGAAWFLVAEDDIEFVYDVDWDELLRSVSNADILQLHTSNAGVVRELAASGTLWSPWASDHWSAGLYMISRAGADTLLSLVGSGNNLSGFSCDSADYIVFAALQCRTICHPICVTSSDLGSFHPDHLRLHEAGANAAKLAIEQSPPPDFCARLASGA